MDQPRHGARQGCEMGISTASGLLVMPRQVEAIKHARHFEQAEIALATYLGEFRGLHPRDAVFGLWRARHGMIMPLFFPIRDLTCAFRRPGAIRGQSDLLSSSRGAMGRYRVWGAARVSLGGPCRTVNVTWPSA